MSRRKRAMSLGMTPMEISRGVHACLSTWTWYGESYSWQRQEYQSQLVQAYQSKSWSGQTFISKAGTG